MKKYLFVFLLLTSSTSFAQNMANSESYQDAYQQMSDGSALYVGKCKTHEDYEGKLFKVTSVVQDYVEPSDYSIARAKQIVNKVGVVPFRMMMNNFFSFEKYPTDKKMIEAFIEYVDDITIETIALNDQPGLELLRFNVGYGGGNGGYLVLRKTSSGYKKMSQTGDSSLGFCDQSVWKK